MNLKTARAELFHAYQSGQSKVVREKAEALKRQANLLFSIAALGGKKLTVANDVDHYTTRVLRALDAADKNGWNIATSATLLTTIQH